MILGLGALPDIPIETNADDIRNPGAWAIRTDSIASTISNLPLNEAGTFVVRSGNGADSGEGDYHYLIQDYIHYIGKIRKTRSLCISNLTGVCECGEWTDI
jgi:hypothetical protein